MAKRRASLRGRGAGILLGDSVGTSGIPTEAEIKAEMEPVGAPAAPFEIPGTPPAGEIEAEMEPMEASGEPTGDEVIAAALEIADEAPSPEPEQSEAAPESVAAPHGVNGAASVAVQREVATAAAPMALPAKPAVSWADPFSEPAWPELGEIPGDSLGAPEVAPRSLQNGSALPSGGTVVGPAPWGSTPIEEPNTTLPREFPAFEPETSEPPLDLTPDDLWQSPFDEERPLPAPPPLPAPLEGSSSEPAPDAALPDLAPSPEVSLPSPVGEAPPAQGEPLPPLTTPPVPIIPIDDDDSAIEPGPAAGQLPEHLPTSPGVPPVVIAPDASAPPPMTHLPGSPQNPSWDNVARLKPVITPEELEFIEKRSIVNEAGEVDPFEEGPLVTIVPTLLSDAARKAVARHVTAAMVSQLSGDVTTLFDRVEVELSSDRRTTNDALRLLNEARAILLSDQSLYPDAELKVRQVRVMLRQSQASSAAAATTGRWLIVWNLLLGALFISGLIFDTWLAAVLQSRGVGPVLPAAANSGITMSNYTAFWLPILAGGLGGVLGALVQIVINVSRRRFDPEYGWRFFAHPIISAIIGAMVYWLFLSGTLLFSTVAQTQSVDLLSPAQRLAVATHPLVLLTAVSLGVAQGPFWRFLDRVVRTVGGSQDDEPIEPASPAVVTTTTTTAPTSRP